MIGWWCWREGSKREGGAASRTLQDSIANRGGDHFQDAAQAVVAGEAAFVERGAGDGLPVGAGAVVFEVLGEAGEAWIVLIVTAAEFVDDQVEGGDDENAEAAGAGFVEGIFGCAGDVSVGVVLELKREGAVRIVG